MTNKQRATLRSLGANLKEIDYVGKDGVTSNVIISINNNLFVHELIKVKVQKTCTLDIIEVADLIKQNCNCEIVSIIGTKILLYKYSEKENIKHIVF